jgi:hypothetical protein
MAKATKKGSRKTAKKSLVRKKSTTRKAAPKAAMAQAAVSPPPVWYFPTEDPNYVIACEWNPVDRAYNRNCRTIPRPQAPAHIQTAIRKSLK